MTISGPSLAHPSLADMQEMFHMMQQQQASVAAEMAKLQARLERSETEHEAAMAAMRTEHEAGMARLRGDATIVAALERQQRAISAHDRIGKELAEAHNQAINRRDQDKDKLRASVPYSVGIGLGKVAGRVIVMQVGETVIEKVAVKVAEIAVKKLALKTGEKFVTSVALKAVPIVGLIVGIGGACRRMYLGHHPLMILGEVASGLASFIPGVGTIVSIGIDMSLVMGDVLPVDIPAPQVPTMSLEQAYMLFNLEPEAPDETVGTRCRHLLQMFHPNAAGGAGFQGQVNLEEIRSQIEKARDLIYEARGIAVEVVHG